MSHLIPRPMCSKTLDSETSLAWKGFLFSLNSCARQMRHPSLGTPYPISLDTYLVIRSAVDFSPQSVVILADFRVCVFLCLCVCMCGRGGGRVVWSSEWEQETLKQGSCHHLLSTVSLSCLHHEAENTEEEATGGLEIFEWISKLQKVIPVALNTFRTGTNKKINT